MRVKIDKYAEGGFFHRATFLPASFTPGPAGPIANSTGTSTVKEEKKLGEEDIYKTLLDKNGLTSDVYRLMADLGQQDIGSLTSTGGTSRVLSLIGKVNEIVNNRKMWEEAASRSIQNGSYEEVAISNGGQLFYKDKEGSIKTISPDDYKKAPSKYGSLMSVADLLNERQNNINYAYDKNIINIAQNSVGLDEIKEDILKLFDTLSSYTDLKERTYSQEDIKGRLQAEQELIVKAGRKPNAQEQQGLAFLTELATTPGEFVKYEEKESGKGRDIAAAYNYILGTLNDKEKRKLEVTAKLSGTTGTEVIKGMLYNVTARSYESKITPVKGMDISGEAGTPKPTTPFEIQHKGQVGVTNINWNDPKTSLRMNLVGNFVELWDNVSSNTRVGVGPLNNLINSHTGALLDKRKIFYGDKQVSLSDSLNIIVDPSGGSARVYFPVDSEGNPNYAIMREVDQIRKTNPGITPEELTSYFKDKGYDYMQFDKNFMVRPNAENVKPFLLLYGYTDERSSSVDNNSEIRELNEKQEGEVKGVLEKMYDEMKLESPTGFWKFNWSNTYYKGNILIPYQETASIIASTIAGNIETPRTTLEHNKIEFEKYKARKLSPSSDLLNQ